MALQRATPTVTRGINLHGDLRGPVTLTPVANRLAVELLLPVLTTVADGIRTTNPPMQGERSN